MTQLDVGTVNSSPITVAWRRLTRIESDLILGWSYTIGWYDQFAYTGHTLTRKDDGWQLVVRARDKRGKKYVKIVRAVDQDTVVRLFNYSLRSKSPWGWTPDKY